MSLELALSALEAQASRFDPTFAQSDRWQATNDCNRLARYVEEQLARLERSEDPYDRLLARSLRERYKRALDVLTTSGAVIFKGVTP